MFARLGHIFQSYKTSGLPKTYLIGVFRKLRFSLILADRQDVSLTYLNFSNPHVNYILNQKI